MKLYPGILCFMILLVQIPLLRSETVTCKSPVDAFDPQDSSRLIGRFVGGSTLEIGEYVPALEMYHVRFKPAGAAEISALCKIKDLGIAPPAAPFVLRTSDDPNRPPLIAYFMEWDPHFWELTSDQFETTHKKYDFNWDNAIARANFRSRKPFFFQDLTFVETHIKFHDNKPREAVLYYGLDSNTEQSFDENGLKSFISQLEGTLGEWTQSKAEDAYVKPSPLDLKRRSFFKKPFRVDIEWCINRNADAAVYPNRFKVEFIRLVFSPYDGSKSIQELTKAIFQSKGSKESVKTDFRDGIFRDPKTKDVWINRIPMTDQSDNGYCVNASADRVLRYMGVDTSIQEINRIVPDTEWGISFEDFFRDLKKTADHYSYACKVIRQIDKTEAAQEARDYSVFVKQMQFPDVKVPKFGIKDLDQFYKRFEPYALRLFRAKDKANYDRFVATVTDYTERGIPLFWVIQKNVMEQQPIQIRRLPNPNHMRLLIGYNKDENVAIYTDSFGPGYEFARIPMMDAYTMTGAIYVVAPAL